MEEECLMEREGSHVELLGVTLTVLCYIDCQLESPVSQITFFWLILSLRPSLSHWPIVPKCPFHYRDFQRFFVASRSFCVSVKKRINAL